METVGDFEVFDLAQTDLPPPRPAVRVTSTGVLLLNRPAWELLGRSGSGSKVYLLFRPEEREAGLLMADPWASGSNVFDLDPNRGLDWPRRVNAPRFVENYQISEGIWEAKREMTSGMLTFWVGAAVPQPAGVPTARRWSYRPEEVERLG